MDDLNKDKIMKIYTKALTGSTEPDYSYYEKPFDTSENKVTCSIGFAHFYGNEGKTLLNLIRKRMPVGFEKIDKDGYVSYRLDTDWEGDRWSPNPIQIEVMKKLLVSKAGIRSQKKLFRERVDSTEYNLHRNPMILQTSMTKKSTIFYIVISLLDGDDFAKTVFNRCGYNYSLDNIYKNAKLLGKEYEKRYLEIYNSLLDSK